MLRIVNLLGSNLQKTGISSLPSSKSSDHVPSHDKAVHMINATYEYKIACLWPLIIP